MPFNLLFCTEIFVVLSFYSLPQPTQQPTFSHSFASSIVRKSSPYPAFTHFFPPLRLELRISRR